MTITSNRTTLAWNTIDVGDEVSALEIPVTATVIVAGAIASRDYMWLMRSLMTSLGRPLTST